MIKILILAGCLFLLSCETFNSEPEERINHIVFCWLKEPGNKVQRAQLIETSLKFREIPGVLEVRTGEVVKSDRAIVDSTYDVAVFLSFNNTDDLQKYLDHEDHVAAVKTILRPLTQKVLVYDFREKFKPYRD